MDYWMQQNSMDLLGSKPIKDTQKAAIGRPASCLSEWLANGDVDDTAHG